MAVSLTGWQKKQPIRDANYLEALIDSLSDPKITQLPQPYLLYLDAPTLAKTQFGRKLLEVAANSNRINIGANLKTLEEYFAESNNPANKLNIDNYEISAIIERIKCKKVKLLFERFLQNMYIK